MATNKSTQRVNNAVTQSNMITVAFMDALGLSDWYNSSRTREEVANAIKTAIGSGGTIVVDDALSLTSRNPVQNKVITAELNEKVDVLNTAPTDDNTTGHISIVLLNQEPATKYNGYLYIIDDSGSVTPSDIVGDTIVLGTEDNIVGDTITLGSTSSISGDTIIL